MLPRFRQRIVTAKALRNCIKVLFGALVGCGLAGFILQGGDLVIPPDLHQATVRERPPSSASPALSLVAPPAHSPSPVPQRRHQGVSQPQNRFEELVLATKCTVNIFLAWTTPAPTFTLRYLRTVESALLFHPRACLVVYSPTLPLDQFQALWDAGYNIIVERPDIGRLLADTPAEDWYKGVNKHKDGPYFFSHITEILRLATLYKYGGIYLDTDVVVMRPLTGLRNAVGTELAGRRDDAKVLNGAVLIFEKGSKFIWECMAIHNATYRINSWGWNGPELVTRTARLFPQKAQLRILPTDAFYPIHWLHIRKYFTTNDMPQQHRAWQRISKLTYLFHYWNKLTKDLVPNPGSLMFKVLNNYCISCKDFQMNTSALGTVR